MISIHSTGIPPPSQVNLTSQADDMFIVRDQTCCLDVHKSTYMTQRFLLLI